MPRPPMSRTPTLISVQATYKLYQADSGAVACDEVINIPLAYVVAKQVRMNKCSYLIVPVVEFNVPLQGIHFNIVTNEGVTVEPFSTPSRSEEANPYEEERLYFVLPRGTTGIKDVVISHNIPTALEYGIMPPPYNYDNALFGVVSSEISDIKETLQSFTPHYGYATQKRGHTVDFSDLAPANFHISEDTRFLTFFITNPLETSTHLNFEIVSNGDASNSVIVLTQIAPGQNKVKVDLDNLVTLINNPTANKHDAYIIPPMEDRYYSGLIFSPNRNESLTGNVEVIEWA